MSRIAPLQPPYAPEIQAQFDRIMRGAAPLVLFRVMAGHPRAWEKFRGGSLLDKGPLSLREREIVIDRTCALNACEYEWGVHVATFAAAAALTQEQVRCTTAPRSAMPNSRRCPLIMTMRRSSRSSCCAASIARCRISATRWRCRWKKRARGFRSNVIASAAKQSIDPRTRSGLLRRFAPRNDVEGAAATPRPPATDRAGAGYRPACRRRSRSAW